MTSKYEALEIFLQGKYLTKTEVGLSFSDIEVIINSKLPKSAFIYRAWWSNQQNFKNRPQAKAWLSARYEVKSCQQYKNSGSVLFVRV